MPERVGFPVGLAVIEDAALTDAEPEVAFDSVAEPDADCPALVLAPTVSAAVALTERVALGEKCVEKEGPELEDPVTLDVALPDTWAERLNEAVADALKVLQDAEEERDGDVDAVELCE